MAGLFDHTTLTANTATPFYLDKRYDVVYVLNRTGTSEIYGTTDGSLPTVGGSNCFVIPAAICSVLIKMPQILYKGPGQINLISSGAEAVSIEAGAQG